MEKVINSDRKNLCEDIIKYTINSEMIAFAKVEKLLQCPSSFLYKVFLSQFFS